MTVRRTALRMVLVVAGAMLVSAGCGDDDAAPVTLVEGVTADVQAIDNTFRPAESEVAAGTEVVWDERRSQRAQRAARRGDDWGVEADAFTPGDEYRHRFTEPGTYDYYCSLHGTTTKGMVGTIVVTG